MLKKTKIQFLVLCYKSTSKIRLGHFSLVMFVSEALLILHFCKPQSKFISSVFLSLTVQKIKCWEFMCFRWDHWWLCFLLRKCNVLEATLWLSVPRNLSFDKICLLFFNTLFSFLCSYLLRVRVLFERQIFPDLSIAYSANLDFTYK